MKGVNPADLFGGSSRPAFDVCDMKFHFIVKADMIERYYEFHDNTKEMNTEFYPDEMSVIERFPDKVRELISNQWEM